jgi:ketosteroid isomerase-like protein
MASGDSDVVRTMLDHWERGEFAPSLRHLHPDVEVVSHISGRRLEGYGGVRRLINDWNDAFDSWSLKAERLLDCPDGRRLAVGRVIQHGKQTGSELDRPCALLFTLEDGLIARMEAFVNRVDEAYAAAGLPPESPS